MSTPRDQLRIAMTSHTLTNLYADVWIFAERGGQFIRTVNAGSIEQDTALVGTPADNPNYHWVRRGPGRHSYMPII